MSGPQPVPRLVAWETTRACPLACIHCRAEAQHVPHPQQLSTAEGKALLQDIASFARPIIILTGGEPLLREDIFELAAYGNSLGLRMVISPDDGRLLTPATVARLIEVGIQRVSFSLHYPRPETHDHFARLPGAFAAALSGLSNLRAGGLPFQINTSVTRLNVADLPEMLRLVQAVGAMAWHLFFLVPTGRGKNMGADEMPPEQYEETLRWLYVRQKQLPIEVKETCAPHFRRVQMQQARVERRDASAPDSSASAPAGHPHSGRLSRGCMCGDGFVFVSHLGDVGGCGYLPLVAGNVRERSFREIYHQAPLLVALRDLERLRGKCGVCEYKRVCSGCRARAYALTGDYLAEEPYCTYQPRAASLATI